MDSPVLLWIYWNFLKLKRGGPNFLVGTNSAEQLNYLVAFLYFNFANLKHPNSLSFIRFQRVPHDSPVLSSIFSNFLKWKRRDLISWWEAILQNGWIIWSPLQYFNSKNLRDSNSSSIIRFQWVLHDSALLLSIFWSSLKLKRKELISSWEPILQIGWIIWSPVLYFNFRNMKHPNSFSFITFQWVLHDSPIFCSIFWNFLKWKRGDLISWWEPILKNGWIISPLLYFYSRNLKD